MFSMKIRKKKENIIVEEDCYNNKHKVYVDVWFKN